jgi:hypothetical protein
MLPYLERCAQTMYLPALQPHLSFFSNFLHILHLCFISDCQYYYIWKCVHRPCIHQPSNLIPHFFLIFCIFYSYVSFMIANVTTFGTMCADHVYTSPQTSSLIFSNFLHILHLRFISDCQYYYIWKCVHRPCMHISPPTSSLIFF